MADTPVFQFDPTGGVAAPSGGPVNRGPQVGITGGGNILSQPVKFDGSPDAVSSTFPSFLQEAFAPALQKAKQEAMWQGFTAARSGQTAQEIHDQQPWFSKIFGPTNFEMGAQMFNVQDATNKVMSQFQQNLPELRKMTSEQLGGVLNQLSSANMTGDPFTDSLIQKSLMDNAGTMLQQHAQARYAWQQETLAKSQYDSWGSAAQAFNDQAMTAARLGRSSPNQAPSPEQQAEATRTFLQQFQSPQGQDPASYEKNIVNAVNTMAQNGQWHAINALESSGIFNQLKPEQQDQLERKVNAARTKFQSKWFMDSDLGKAMAQTQYLAARGAISAQTVFDSYSSINQQYQALTGDKQPLVQMSEYVGTAKSAGEALLRIQQENIAHANRLAEGKALADYKEDLLEQRDSRKLAIAIGGVNSGYAGALKGIGGVSNDVLDQAALATIRTQPDKAPQVLVGNLFSPTGNHIFPEVQTQIQNNVQRSAGESWTPAFEKQYDLYQQLTNYVSHDANGNPDSVSGPAAATQYFGKYAAPMQTYSNLLAAGTDRQLAYRRAFGDDATTGITDLRSRDPQGVKNAQTAIASAVSDQNAGWLHPFTPDMGVSAVGTLQAASTKYFMDIKAHDPTVSDKDAALRAVQIAMAHGLEKTDRYAWNNAQGQQNAATTINNTFHTSIDPQTFNQTFDSLLTNTLRGNGISVGKSTSVTVLRLPDDPKKGPVFGITAADGKGGERTILLTGKEIEKQYNDDANWQLEGQKRKDALMEASQGGVPDIN